MGNRKRTRESYEAVVAAFLRYGVNFGVVATAVGMDRGTVANLYKRGWPDKEGFPPVQEKLNLLLRATRVDAPSVQAPQLLVTASPSAVRKANKLLEAAQKRLAEAEEKAALTLEGAERAAQARVARAESEANARMQDLLARAKVDAAETLADEANAVKFGRKAALSVSGLVAIVLKDAQAWARQIREGLNLEKLPPLQKLQAARALARLVEATQRAVILSLQAERLRVGQPTEVLGVASLDSSLEEREVKLHAVARALARKRASHLALVPPEGREEAPVEGGAGENQPGDGQVVG